MVGKQRLTIAAIFVIAVVGLSVWLGPMLLTLDLTPIGPSYPGKVVNQVNPASGLPGADWANPGTLAGAQGDAFKQLTPLMTYYELNYLYASTFTFAIPSTASISGVQLGLSASTSDCEQYDVQLVTHIGLGSPSSQAKTTDLCSQSNGPLGGQQDSWGLTLSGADAPNIGVWIYAKISVRCSGISCIVSTVHVNTIALTLYSQLGGGGSPGAFAISMTLQPASGKSSTSITATIHTNPIQASTNIHIQVRKSGSGAWQELTSGQTDLTGTLTKTWLPQDYSLTQDGTYLYRAITDDGSIFSDQVSFIQAANPPPSPPPTPTDWTTIATYALIIGALVAVAYGAYVILKKREG